MRAPRYLGIDPGGRRVGVAVADGGVVTPVAVIPYQGASKTARALGAQAEIHKVSRIVIGLPAGADGAESPACQRSRALAEELEKLGHATALQSEFLSSREAKERARAAGRPTGRPVDDLAAAIILEDYLEQRARHRAGGTGADEE